MRFKTFQKHLFEISEDVQYQKKAYLKNQILRFYYTYKQLLLLVKNGDKVLTIGGGACYIEALLKTQLQIKIDSLDFPRVIEKNKLHYNKYGINGIKSNFVDDEVSLTNNYYDYVFSFEVIEHVKEAPSVHFKKFLPYCKPDCKFIITTPNIGNITNIICMLRGKPYLQSPELTFSPTSEKNEFIHRREYLPKEMVLSLEKINLETQKISYIRKTLPVGTNSKIKNIIFKVLPRMRPIFLVIAKIKKAV